MLRELPDLQVLQGLPDILAQPVLPVPQGSPVPPVQPVQQEFREHPDQPVLVEPQENPDRPVQRELLE